MLRRIFITSFVSVDSRSISTTLVVIAFHVVFAVLTSDFSKHLSFIATINNITFQFPSFPLLSERDRIVEEMFCDVHKIHRKSCVKNSRETICKCIHRLKVKLNSSVEILALNTLDKIPHPLHLHGHKFHVVDMGVFNGTTEFNYEELGQLRSSNEVPSQPPYKDTCVLPFPGFVKFRFRASNPGFWLFHCHCEPLMNISNPNVLLNLIAFR
jgi:Multicopper oxidase